jgi:hypothetical protein
VLVSVDWPGIASDLPPGSLLRVRADLAARIWTDPADAAFAAEYGIPYSDGLFRILTGAVDRDPASPDTAFVDGPEPDPVETPQGVLVKLGLLYGGELFVSRSDGTVLVSDPDADVEYEPIHRDLSSLSYLLYLIEGEKPRPEENPNPYDWADAEAIVREKITRWDPLPFAEEDGFWGRYLESYAMY